MGGWVDGDGQAIYGWMDGWMDGLFNYIRH